MEIPTLKCPIRKEVVEGIEEQADCMGNNCVWFTKCFDSYGVRKAAMNKTTKDVMFSSKSDEWSTPIEIYEKLDLEFHFDLDPCATAGNHKCSKYYTTDQDGLTQNWGGVQSLL